MSRTIRCFHLPKFIGRAVVNPGDRSDPDLTWVVSQIRKWAASAKPGDEFRMIAARFTKRELGEMGEYDG